MAGKAQRQDHEVTTAHMISVRKRREMVFVTAVAAVLKSVTEAHAMVPLVFRVEPSYFS